LQYLKEAQDEVQKISKKYDEKNVYTSAFFIALIEEQLGQIAEKYLHQGREAPDIEVDIADVIVCSLAYLNWLGKDASVAFAKALKKHEARIKALQKA
jgi:NTP pyrophosphatase (non-canonical NTP hydrolase)